ncbi:hypothetical protein PEP31012_03591 [Pandoraea eparura]|uniref:Fis family transcriptional regulator n=1 Tax=Pandoraea eparura TaxID=2508291 RepID=A0A5E4WZK2_9BURK|nr:hypothetical protein [Pandoraea eparura]VVE29455.1 hypothetical protein PEP31012_03591 [Pandoraea eparura]
MSRTKHPRRRYDPNRLIRRAAESLDRKSAALPLDQSQTTDIGLTYHLSLDAIKGGYATEEIWSNLACSVNIALILAEQGTEEARIEDIKRAQDALMRAKARSERFGTWGLDGDGIRDLQMALTVHDSQMKTAPKAQVRVAINEMHRRMAAGDFLEIQR